MNCNDCIVEIERSGGSIGGDPVETQYSDPGRSSGGSGYISQQHPCDCQSVGTVAGFVFLLLVILSLVLARIYDNLGRSKS